MTCIMESTRVQLGTRVLYLNKIGTRTPTQSDLTAHLTDPIHCSCQTGIPSTYHIGIVPDPHRMETI